MESSFVHQKIPSKKTLNLYVVQYNHFPHNLQEDYLVGILPNRLQHIIFED